MHISYWMVLVNVVSVVLLSTGLLFYRYVYPKKKINLFILLILSSLLPLVSILRPGSYESGDLSINTIKTIALFRSLREGVFLPWWAGDLNATYGYPLFLFTYPLPYYLAVTFHLVGFGYLLSMKLLLMSSFIVSGLTMYWFVKTYFGKVAGFIAGIFYLYTPYHLIDMHFRVDIGECVAFIFMPLIFLFATQVIEKKRMSVFLLALSICLLILSHQAISLIFIPISALYAVLLVQKNKSYSSFLPLIIAFTMGILLSSFYVVPLLIESKNTYQFLFAKVSFPQVFEFLYAPWIYGFLFQGNKGELSFLIGYAQIIVVFIGVFFLLQKKLQGLGKLLLIFSLLTFFVLFFMMQKFSEPIWYSIPLIRNFQFSWRLLALVSFFLSVIAGVCSTKITNKKILILLVFIAICSTILNWGNRRSISTITDSSLIAQLPLSSHNGEGLGPAMPKWVNRYDPFMSVLPRAHLEVLKGKGTIIPLAHRSTYHSYLVKLVTDATLKENTLYFPGWQILANKTQVPFAYQNKLYPGIMLFSLSKGKYLIEATYEPPLIKTIGVLLSLISSFVLLFYTFQSVRYVLVKFSHV